jgi:hypothetical protein
VFRGRTTSESMIPYFCWSDMSPKEWVSRFYAGKNVLYHASASRAAGACRADGSGWGATICDIDSDTS